MGYQFFLPMVLRWRASRAEAPLIIIIIVLNFILEEAANHSGVLHKMLIDFKNERKHDNVTNMYMYYKYNFK